MSVRQRRHGWVHTTALSWRYTAHRYSFVFLLVLSVGLLIIGHNKPFMVERFRAQVVDGLAPVFDALSRPLVLADNISQQISDVVHLREENARLRAENALLLQWQNAAIALESENKELRGLLKYTVEPKLAYISARVIADAGGPFVRSLVVTAGKMDGVREGMAAMTGDGLIGRVVEAGDWSSRILLLTDLNSRIPVTVTGTGDHAIVAGDNSPKLKLMYLPPDAVLPVGARIVTSGHGGVFPPNLPVATVTRVARGQHEVAPLASLGRVSQVRLVDFNLKGGDFNPMAAQLEPANKN